MIKWLPYLLCILFAMEAYTTSAQAELFGGGGLFRSARSRFAGQGARRGLSGMRKTPRRRSMGQPRNSRNLVNNRVHGQNANFGFRFNQFDSFLDPGVGVTGFPQGDINPNNFAVADPNAFASIIPTNVLESSGDQGVAFQNSLQSAVDPGNIDPCGLQQFNASVRVNVISQGFFFDRSSGTCRGGSQRNGVNPFPFASEQQCVQAVQAGGCRLSGFGEVNQVVFRR